MRSSGLGQLGLPGSEDKPYGTQRRDQLASLDLRFENGGRHCLAWHGFIGAKMPTAAAITLNFADALVTIRGRNLDPLYDAIRKQSVEFIREDGEFTEELEDACEVQQITVSGVKTDSGA